MKYLLIIFLSFFIFAVHADPPYCNFLIKFNETKDFNKFIKVLDKKIEPLEYFKSILHSKPKLMSVNSYAEYFEDQTVINEDNRTIFFIFGNGIGYYKNKWKKTKYYLKEWAELTNAEIVWNNDDHYKTIGTYKINASEIIEVKEPLEAEVIKK